ncbi:uncharacterized protein LOC111088442, partial [Limulus polyphemus]|uniref:Uncharacterized protein LOC111088442 n=1 Tax=Limulus polyphemus TaxID=6850 RepID=A0ABM1TEG9_LIMPO
FVIVKFYKGYKYDFASEINFSVKKDCYCNQLKVGLYILLSVKGPWSKVGYKYDVMQMTDEVYLVNYNSRNEGKIEKKLKYCEPYLPPIPSTDCPSAPYSCLNCHEYLDYKLEEIICTFDFILKIDIKTLPDSRYKYFCGKFVIVNFYKGNEHNFASEISYSVKKSCSCEQLKIGKFWWMNV